MAISQKSRLLLGIITLASLPITPVFADSTVKFHGTLIAASCSADAVDVDFGDVSLDLLPEYIADTKTTYSVGAMTKEFTLNIKCSGTSRDDVQFKFTGSGTAFNSALYPADNMENLAVLITDSKINMGIKPDIWYTAGTKGAGQETMQAMLVRKKDATFSGGNFNVTTTVTIQLP